MTTRRSVLKGMGAALAAAAVPVARGNPATGYVPLRQAGSLDDTFDESIVIDALSYLYRNPDAAGADHSQLDFPMLDSSGVTVVSSTVDSRSRDPQKAFRDAVAGLSRVSALAARYADRVVLVRTAVDIESAKRQGKLGVLANFQDSVALGIEGENLPLLHELGVRQIQVTYNWRNLAGDGCLERTDAGLSYFGVELVERLNEAGIVVDVSHSGYRTTLDAIEASRKPVLISHANCRSLYDHPRNKSDEQIRAMARKGGVMGIAVLSWYASENPRPDLEDLLDHFDHIIRVVGPDHVGFGSDMGLPGWRVSDPDVVWEAVRSGYSDRDWDLVRPRYPPFIEAVNDASRYRTIARGLHERGYSLDDVRKVLGANLLRVYREAL